MLYNILIQANAEIDAFYKAAREVGYTEKPHIVYVIYNKTANARFFDGNNNPPSGSCFDTQIVQIDHYCWYMIAHTNTRI